VTSQLQSDLVGGEVPVSFQLLPNVIAALKAGQVRALAVANPTRLPALPDVPTAAELGVKGYESSAWFGFVAPRGTPRPIVDKLNAAFRQALEDPQVRENLAGRGAFGVPGTPEDLATHVAREYPMWVKLVKDSGAKVD